MKRLSSATLLIVFVAILVQCSSDQPQPVPQKPFTAAAYFIESVPSFDIHRVDSVRTVPQEQLAEFFGTGYDDIEKFRPLGLAATRYRAGNTDISVELTQYPSIEDAFGAYSVYRPDGIETQPIGIEAYAVGVTQSVVNGEFVLTLSALESDSAALAERTLLAQELVSRMPEGDFPGFFLLFPMRWQIKPSYQYYPKNFMGVEGLDQVYTINYEVDSVNATFFLSEDLSGEKYIKLSEYAATLGSVTPAPDTIMFYDHYGIQYDDPNYGHIITGIVRSKVVGVLYYQPVHLHLTYLWVKGLQ
ncbi:MAG TPA: hypothetical protein PLF13_04845 [candidate division Zixibacteria bacterium]|nr:hypothetical protein [candidate division Zixibacteria bacterium]